MAEKKTRVQVKEGTLQGKLNEYQNKTYISFKGIPYAKPPIGHLRFSAPQAPESWEGIKDASEHRDYCLQLDMLSRTKMGSEDCLYLNVYTPCVDGKVNSKYPVMVYVHGGAFVCGSGDSPMHGPEHIVARDVILVTLNYRVEVLGFLCVDTEDVPGNAGLKDQVAALRWVKENISNFGGDPNNITLFGESAGSASVTYHLVSQMSKNLFHAAIAQSGVCTSFWALQSDATFKAFKLGKLLGKNTKNPKELIEFLRTIPANDLVNITRKVLSKDEIRKHIDLVFLPVIEKVFSLDTCFINQHPEEFLSIGKINSVPLIIGYTDGEGMLFINQVIEKSERINKDFTLFIKGLSKQNISDKVANNIKSFYFKDLAFSQDSLESMVNLKSDLLFGLNIYNFAREFALRSKFPVYFYEFSCRSELNVLKSVYGAEGINLTAHGEDLFYLFRSFLTDGLSDFSSNGSKMAHKLLTLWTNMAKFRDPTPVLDDTISKKWIPLTKNKFCFMKMSEQFSMKTNPSNGRLDFLNSLLRHKGFESKY